jgi:hypothetical protein
MFNRGATSAVRGQHLWELTMKGSEFKELIASLDTMTPAQTAKFREALKAEAERPQV